MTTHPGVIQRDKATTLRVVSRDSLEGLQEGVERSRLADEGDAEHVDSAPTGGGEVDDHVTGLRICHSS